MNTLSVQALRGLLSAALLAGALCLSCARLHAAPPTSSAPTMAPIVLADEDFNWRLYWSRFLSFMHDSFRSRARLVQISAVAVAFGLFIMFRARNT